MGWGTTLVCGIYYNKKTYDTKYSVEEELEDLNDRLRDLREDILLLSAATDPNKVFPKSEEPLTELRRRIKEDLEEIDEVTIDIFKLELLLENWDACHDKDGYAIDTPDNIEWDSAFLYGDFIEKHP